MKHKMDLNVVEQQDNSVFMGCNRRFGVFAK